MAACLRIAGMSANDSVIMVVDDERDFLQLTQKLLERHGYRVDARTRAPSWRELLHIDPAVILMVVILDGENGADVCRAIKSHKRLAGLPIILISGHGEDRLQKEVSHCHANGYLTKPIGRVLLLQLADHFVRQHERAGGLHGAPPVASPPEKTSPKARPHQNPAAPYENEISPLESSHGMRARAEKEEGSET